MWSKVLPLLALTALALPAHALAVLDAAEIATPALATTAASPGSAVSALDARATSFDELLQPEKAPSESLPEAPSLTLVLLGITAAAVLTTRRRPRR